jgi:hypothetical protein
MLAIALVIVLTGLLIFLMYSIVRVAFKAKETSDNAIVPKQESKKIPYRASFDESTMEEPELRMANSPPPQVLQKANEVAAVNTHTEEPIAEINEPQEYHNEESRPNQTPEVVGQPPNELTSPEPLQEKVSNKAESHSPMDPYEKQDNVALFGSNLRHPEASMEKSSANFGALENEIVAGIASQVSKPTDLDKVQFSAEMAQNGGEFMNGIFAYDSSEGGSYFSSL